MPDRIVVVPNGVPPVAAHAAIGRSPADVGRWASWPCSGRARASRFCWRPWPILRDRGMPVHLRAVGTFESPAYQAEIAAQVERLQLGQHVTWTGFTRDVTAELQRMDLFVLPSLFGEGLPMVVLEAMAAGTPVVATRVAGVPEAIRHGRDGVLADPGDAQGLARAIAEVMSGQYDWDDSCVAARWSGMPSGFPTA